MEDHIKQKILVLAVLVVIVFVGFWIYDSQGPKPAQSQTDSEHACAVNFLSTFLNNATTTNKQVIAKTLLSQLLSAYEQIPNCPALDLSDYAITSVSNIKNVQGDFTADAVFNVLPISKSQTAWTTASTTWNGNWIDGRYMHLGIHATVGATSTSYWLVVPVNL